MKVTMWSLEKIIPYARNARKIPAQAIDKVAASLREFGWRQPIVVDREGVIICGHTRLLAAQKLGLTEAPVHVAENLTPAQVRAYRLLDNRSHEESGWDPDLLSFELLDLRGMGVDLDLTGFNMDEIDAFLANGEAGLGGLTDEDAIPDPPAAPVSARGDVWVLGKHRVQCGDATQTADVETLMAGQAGDLVFTDPPYNVAYEGYTDQRLTIQNDRLSEREYARLLTAAFRCCRVVVKPSASLYICHPSSSQREFQNALEGAGFEVRCQIIWAKNTFAWGFGRYKYAHEPIFYCHLAGQSDPWYGDKAQSTVWQENKPAANRLHPTMKPVELIERTLLNSSKVGDTVTDLFGGSGSTLIACERRQRQARLIEIDPIYVDVTVQRWQLYTGKSALRERDGRSFAEAQADRAQMTK